MWKVALIGTGYWSAKHLQAWQRIPNAQVVALCNRSLSKLKQTAEQYRVPDDRLYHVLSDMLDCVEFDILDIVTGPETHLEIVKQAAHAGKHIMCQKPFAPSIEDAETMAQITRKCGVRLMVTENWRWLKSYQMIKQVLDEGWLGMLHTASYIHTDYYTPLMAPGREIPQPFFRAMPRLLFYEMGTHSLDVWRFLFGEPKRLYAEMKRISPHIHGEDAGIVTLGYADFFGTLEMNWASRRELSGTVNHNATPNHVEQLIIEGDTATLKMSTSGKIELVRSADMVTVLQEQGSRDPEDSHFRLQSHFIRCLSENSEFQTSADDNLKTLQLVFAAYESAMNQQVIHLS